MPKKNLKPVKKTASKSSTPASKKAKSSEPKKKAAPAKARRAPARVSSYTPDDQSEILGIVRSVTTTEIALRAYYLGERRQSLGLPGSAENDWLEAERQLHS